MINLLPHQEYSPEILELANKFEQNYSGEVNLSNYTLMATFLKDDNGNTFLLFQKNKEDADDESELRMFRVN